jgi:hypothetical protein
MQATDKTYNGWTNYETSVALHLDNDTTWRASRRRLSAIRLRATGT